MVELWNTFNAFSEQHTFKNFKHAVSNGIASIWKENLLTDVVIITRDGHEFPCHRLLLASTSCYFRAMFTSGLEESRNGVVNFSTINGNSLQIILNFLYTGSLTISNDTVFTLLETADFLQIQSIIDLCISELKNHVNKETCIGLLLFSLRSHSFNALKKFTFQALLNNFKDFINSRSFCFLPKNIVLEIINSSKLRVNSEKLVFDAILYWGHGDQRSKRDIFDLLEYVQFERIDYKSTDGTVISQINEIINGNESDADVSSSQMKIMKRITNSQLGLQTHVFNREQAIVPSPRLPRQNIILFVTSEDGTSTEFRIDFKDHYKDVSLNKVSVIGVCCREISSCRNKPIAIGDDLLMHSRGCLVKYNLKNRQLQTVRSPPDVDLQGREFRSPNGFSRTIRGSSCVELNGGIYCVGGQRGFMNQCLCYDPNIDEWESCDGFSHPSSNPLLVTDKDKFYIVRQEDTESDERNPKTEIRLVGYSLAKRTMIPEVNFTVDGDSDSSSQMTIHNNFIYMRHNGKLTKIDTVLKKSHSIEFGGDVLYISAEVCEEKVYAVVIKNRTSPVLCLYVEDQVDGYTNWKLIFQEPIRSSFRRAVTVTALVPV